MTCRHTPGDPDCSSYPQWKKEQADKKILANAKKLGIGEELPETPDAERFEIVRDEMIGKHLVLTVQYPNCKNCSHEGRKTMVFLCVSYAEAFKWRRIDPHFRGPQKTQREAPSPAARFPATDEGWADAVAYARNKP